uniref:Large ribosomal subunit protein bL32m n=1 Tax=Hevea brasiliensis TaxID=3981 RepID=I3NMQ1_HEVBR|nr:50S ribosomal protein L32pA [Hevea brasiliensis]
MALRIGMLKTAVGKYGCTLSLLRWAHIASMPSPLDGSLQRTTAPPDMVLPEFDTNPDNVNSSYRNNLEFGFPSFSFGGSIEVMAVPKKKVSPHKRGIRNGPKALKPTPVIIRCRSCGRIKLPHFYCCSGDRGKAGEQNN